MRRASTPSRVLAALSLAAALLLARPAVPAAHEIPSDVTILAFVRPEGRTLRLLVRVPLEAMRDVELPLRGPGYLELARVDTLLRDAAQLWIADGVRVYEGTRLLANPAIAGTRISLPSDRSFTSYEAALLHMGAARLDPATELPWQQAMLDVLLEYAITAETAEFSVDPEWGRLGLRTTTVLRFAPPNGTERVLQYDGDPGLIRLEPHWYQAALQFMTLGFRHILDGIDHLLFLLCLIIPFRTMRPLVAIVTAFTVAHSITLIASAYGLAPGGLWFPPLIELLIALSILYMAFENIVGARLEKRWLVAFGFGLVHGFGFSFALRDSLQFAGQHVTAALLAFNVGVELGQLLVIAIALPLLMLAFRYVVAERIGTIILSALVAHTAWHWMTERGAQLREYRIQWTALDGAFLMGALRLVLLAIIAASAGWLLHGAFDARSKAARKKDIAVQRTE